MWEDALAFGVNARIGLGHAIPLGILMGLFQVDQSVDVFWILLTVFLVLRPERGKTRSKAGDRTAGTIAAVLLIGALAQVIPSDLVVVIACVLLVIGISKYEKSYLIYTVGITALVVAIHGSADGDFLGWAGLRLVDTLIGVAIALTFSRLFMPVESPEPD